MQAYDAPDVVGGLRSMVLSSTEVMTLLAESEAPPTSTPIPAADRVYGQAIPRADIEASDTFHPPKMIVIRYGGASAAKNDLLPIDRPAVTVLCYGESEHEADRVRRAIWKRFTFSNSETHGGVCIYDLSPTSGPVPNRDPDIVWPATAQTYTCMTAAEEVA